MVLGLWSGRFLLSSPVLKTRRSLVLSFEWTKSHITMDEHGKIHADNLAPGQKVVVAGKVPSDLYITPGSDHDDIGRKYESYFGMIKYVLIDLSGTLHIENQETPSAIKALEKLRAAGIHIRFVTNTTKESKNLLYDRLTTIGFEVYKEEIFTSLLAARKKIEDLSIRPYFLLEDEALEDFEGINTDNPSGVVVGLSPTNFNYVGLSKAFKLLLHGCPLIAIHKGKYYSKGEGMLALGPGPFVHALEYATDSNAVVVGKPNPDFFRSAIDDKDVPPHEVVMIGDDVADDVIGAMDAGYHGILVKTGKYQYNDELKCHPKFPTLLVDDFSQAVDVILACKAIAAGESLKVIEQQISPSELKRNWEEKEKERQIAAYAAAACQPCYHPPPTPPEPREHRCDCDRSDST